MGRTGRQRKKKRILKVINVSHDPVYLRLHTWLKSLGFDSQPPLKLAVFPGSGRGLQALNTIQPGEVIVTIPIDAMITRNVAVKQISSHLDRNFIGRLSTQTILSVWLLLESIKGKMSSYFSYLETLPKCYSTPYFCTDAEKILLPNYLLSKVAEQSELIKKNHNLLFSRGFETSMTSFEWAWFTVNTRAVYLSCETRFNNQFSVDTDECMALAPYLDLLNHSFEAEVAVGLNIHSSANGYQIVTRKRISKSSQAFINYGPHDNTKLVLEYGFSLAQNPHECFNLSFDIVYKFVCESFALCMHDKKVSLLKSNGLDRRLSITDEGLSWNLMACFKVLLMTEAQLDKWHSVFQYELSEDKEVQAFAVQFISRLEEKIANILGKMNKYCDKGSENFLLCRDLVNSHHVLLHNAKKTFVNHNSGYQYRVNK